MYCVTVTKVYFETTLILGLLKYFDDFYSFFEWQVDSTLIDGFTLLLIYLVRLLRDQCTPVMLSLR